MRGNGKGVGMFGRDRGEKTGALFLVLLNGWLFEAE